MLYWIKKGKENRKGDMIPFIRKFVFADSGKNTAAPHIFLILCAYAAITTTYSGVLFDAATSTVRFILDFIIIAIFVVMERLPVSNTVTAFLSPTLIAVVLVFGAILEDGDGLLFIYISCVALISLSYFSSKGLAAYIVAEGFALVVILFALHINLLGDNFTMLYNTISFIACLGLNALAYSFCIFCVKMLNALTEAKNEASLAAQAKGNFLANMSHEIRTPLNAIIGFTEAELRRDLSEEDFENLHKIHSSSNLLLGIINDILDMSKIESGKFDLAPAEYVFADMIYDTVALNMVRIESKPVKLTVSVDENIPSRIVGDELRVKQILNNLLSNAIKYTTAGSIELHVSGCPAGNGVRLFFSVADTGIGIRESDLKMLFSKYYQVGGERNRGIEGTGLGLSICKGLTEMMGGKISAQSEYGTGSTFTAEIWQEASGSSKIGSVAAALENFTYSPEHHDAAVDYMQMPHAKVLVVDDVDMNLEVAVCCLEPYGMHVDCTDNGADAVRRVKSGEPRYDLILMDHMMPEMDGIEAVHTIREIGTEYALSVPIVALTANALSGNDKMFADNGFQGFLAKPIDLLKLDAVLHKWVCRFCAV
ncbi:MAG: ATP-binding protein [Clostridiales bacterium]|nr:ATP-binding protein [Clostridiales bacterium]